MSSSGYEAPPPGKIRDFFSAIAPYYDFLNRALSFLMDGKWRNRAVDLVLEGHEASVLDIGTGTGKFLQAFLKKHSFRRVCGVDFCRPMLAKGRQLMPGARVLWVESDISETIPVKRNSFDLVTAAFALRSLKDIGKFFCEAALVLAPGGKIALLELTRPGNVFLKALYFPYLKFILPAVGSLVSKSAPAYAFLSRSILNFQEPESLKALLMKSGFREVRTFSFTGGAVTLLIGRRT